MRGSVMLLVVALLVAVLSASLADSTRRRPLLRECRIDGLDRMARCGEIAVLESDRPPRRRIAIRFVIVPATAPAPSRDPVVFLAGGPGQGTAELAAPMARRLGFLADTRDLVFVDQRGTGASHPLKCPDPESADELMGRIFDLERLKVCRNQLAQRADLGSYTTPAAAPDYVELFDALGYAQVNVWGASYGTRLALELARRLQNRIRSLILEAPVPLAFDWPTSGARDADEALETLIADCEGDHACSNAYPSFRRDVEAAFTALENGPVRVTMVDPISATQESVTFGASDLAYAVRGVLYGADAVQLPQWFRMAAAGDYRRLAQAYVTRARTLRAQIAAGVHLGVYCAEDVPFVNLRRVRDASAGTRLGTFLLDQYVPACDIWPRGTIPESFREPMRSSVPALLMTGRRDPVTPPWTAQEVAKSLTRARVITWPAGGHGYDGLQSPTCRQQIIREFIESADPQRISTECVATAAAVPFVN